MIKLTNKQFRELITKVIKEINSVQYDTYTLVFNGDSAVIGQTSQLRDNTFYLTYMDTFFSLKTLYDISMFFKSEEDKPVLIISKD